MLGTFKITILGLTLCAQLGGACDEPAFDSAWWRTYAVPEGMIVEYSCFEEAKVCDDKASADEECFHAFDWCCSIDGMVSHHYYCRMKGGLIS